MYQLMIRQFLRTKTCQLGLILILALGLTGIVIGKQFLNDKEKMIAQTVEKQEEHIARNIKFHGDDLGLLLYYLKFSIVKAHNPLTGLSIGQDDLNPSIQQVKILTLEGQKYDMDLVNPTRLLYGNLDLSFILVYIFPLLIIAFTYNLLSEEEETGTWKMVRVTVKSQVKFLLMKLSLRLFLLVVLMSILYLIAAWVLGIAWEEAFFAFFIVGLLYQLFWFSLSFWITLLKRNSSFNAVVLLSFWLILVMLLPAVINNAITNKYPVPEALTTVIKQRDGYHQKWDTNKKETIEKFYKNYPQFAKYGYPPEEGFNWLWYYTMQHLGDEESRKESNSMRDKVLQRQKMSKQLAKFFPSMHSLLVFNDLAGSSLSNHIHFLQYISNFHENIRLFFYPKIFSQATTVEIDWEQFKPAFYEGRNQPVEWLKILVPLLAGILIFLVLSFLTYQTL
ncbi:MAG: DUF3526 domain-containing protein [Ekhidna sp.]|nr:DUF3526 domain-containing protein [Ekhidna sp.]